MQWFLDLKIGTKLLAGFVFVAIIAAAIGYVGVTSLNTANDSDTVLYEKRTVPIVQMGKMSTLFQRVRVNTRDILLAKSSDEIEDFVLKIKTYRDEMTKLSGEIEKSIDTQEERQIFDEFKQSRIEYGRHLDVLMDFGRNQNDVEGFKYLNGEMKAASNREQEIILKMMDLYDLNASKQSDANTVAADAANRFMLIFLGIGVISSVVLGIFLSRLITKPLIEAVAAANKVAEGDMTIDLVPRSKDEVGQLVGALGNMVQHIAEVIEDVMVSADNVASGSQELSATSEQMSQGATEQAAAAEEASSSTEQMVSNIRQNADNAHQTDGIASRSAEDAKLGGASVHQTVDAMKKIASKISIIEEIARQTNLLALNAAIEAARAGEHGKGFAVVASEVRKLAERSQTAAGEINQLASSSVEIAVQAGEMLVKLVPDIQKTAELVQEISSASAEQSTGVSQINKAIQQLDQVIQQNASASEQMSATSEELAAQAEQLKSAISFFKLKNGSHGRINATRHAPPAHGAFTQKSHLQKTLAKPVQRRQPATPQPESKGTFVLLDEVDHNHHDDSDFEKY
jgi:methyl-accepting chemotaxis protein